MLKVEEAVGRIQELLRTMDDGEAVSVFRDGRLAVVPVEQARRPEPERFPGDEGPVEYFVPGGTMPDEEVRARLETALNANPERRPIQGS